MNIIKIIEATKTVEEDHPTKAGKTIKVQEHYGYWLTVKTYLGASDRFVISEQVYPKLYNRVHTKEITEGDNVISLLEAYC